jgi:hypothetical protein
MTQHTLPNNLKTIDILDIINTTVMKKCTCMTVDMLQIFLILMIISFWCQTQKMRKSKINWGM